MNATNSYSSDFLPDIPNPETIRLRLAVITTEAALLRAQLKVSQRLQHERERLRELVAKDRDA